MPKHIFTRKRRRGKLTLRQPPAPLDERANGYSYDAVKIFMPAGSKQPVVVHYVEHMPPDVTAGIFWLGNRDPENWRDVQNVYHVLGEYLISDRPMTEEQWAAERATIIDETPIEELPAPDTKRDQLMLTVIDGMAAFY
jgi:hypothetical protein